MVNKKEIEGKKADLSYADLRSADLCSANLHYANLHSADLSYADLSNADLRYLSIDKQVIQINTPPYPLIMIGKQVQIGCEIHLIENWLEFGEIIAKKNNLNNNQIEIYRKYIEILNAIKGD